ncbi:MAG: sugar-binding transcriptional regulator [Candidatus Latescibacteria bacterium]|jgi:DNA-binding transcriptional regulator LsrR (DeoR family)|nr:sugar-binding transcriptional regulator [Candidatus Latescibacterota bacterium]
MSRIDELRLMTKVARMYYEQGLRQAVIATRLNLSQATTSRLLKRAEKEQIVRISVHVPRGIHAQLEEDLQAAYGLQEAIVADCEGEDERGILRGIGSAAAFYLESTIAKNEVVGISSWSETLLSVVDAMHPLPLAAGVRIVQILGGIGNPVAEAHASRLVGRLATLVKGEANALPAPGVVGSVESLDVLRQDSYVRTAVEMFDHVSLALLGIGAIEPSTLLASSGNTFTSDERKQLKKSGAVGDVLLRFFDADGQPVDSALDARVTGMNLEQLRQVPRVVAIAGGQRKWKAVRGALTGGLIDVMITDQYTAATLVKQAKDSK